MKLLGFDLGFKSAIPAMGLDNTSALVPAESEGRGGWFSVVREGFTGAWQRNITIRRDSVIAFTAVYACLNRISQDLGKMPLQLMELSKDDIWKKVVRTSPFWKVLRKPNDYQTRSQFIVQWTISKLLAGNTFVLKQRDGTHRNLVVKLFVLNPLRVRPMITPDGSIFYEVAPDPLSEQFAEGVLIPASEIIHDRMPGLFHPLVGTSPIFSCGLAAAQGHHMQRSSAAFFKNMASPSGILTAPGAISNETAARLKEQWNAGFTGAKVGAVAVLGDGLKFEKMTVSAQDAQIIEQLRWSSENVCSAFSVPPFMVGMAPWPINGTVEAVQQQYWSLCLQSFIQDIETLMTEGLEVAEADSALLMGIKMNEKALLRMDTASRFAAWKNAISGTFMAPNEARKEEDLPPLPGGDALYMQQQNYSLEALSARDKEQIANPASAKPAVPIKPLPAGGSGDPNDDNNDDGNKDDANKNLGELITDEDEIDYVNHMLHVEFAKTNTVQA